MATVLQKLGMKEACHLIVHLLEKEALTDFITFSQFSWLIIGYYTIESNLD